MALWLLVSIVLVAEPRWEPGGSSEGVHWSTRAREGSPVRELQATALLDATPGELWAVLSDFEGWVKTMPSTDAAVVVARDAPGQTLLYLRYVLPLIAPRDTLIELTERADPDGRQVLSWKAAPEARDVERPLQAGVVRLRINEGFWQLEPREGGAKTFVTYRLLSAPAGDVPAFFVNRANTLGVPRTFEALRVAVRQRRAKP